jgi:hypothetical protein
LSRASERLERHVTIGNEALALFVPFWLTSTSPVPDTMQASAQAKGRERYEGFVEALGRRIARGQTLAHEIVLDPEGAVSVGAGSVGDERADGAPEPRAR